MRIQTTDLIGKLGNEPRTVDDRFDLNKYKASTDDLVMIAFFHWMQAAQILRSTFY